MAESERESVCVGVREAGLLQLMLALALVTVVLVLVLVRGWCWCCMIVSPKRFFFASSLAWWWRGWLIATGFHPQELPEECGQGGERHESSAE